LFMYLLKCVGMQMRMFTESAMQGFSTNS